MVTAEQNGRDFSAVPLLGAGVLGVLQEAVPVALLGVAALLRQYAGHHAAQTIGNRHGGDLAACQHKVAQGQLFIHALVKEALIHALIVTADENKAVILGFQFLCHLLIEGTTAGGHIDGVDALPCLVTDMLPAAVEGIGLHHRAATAAVGVVVHLHLLVGGIVADLMGHHFHIASLLCPTDDGLTHHGLDGIGKEGHNVNSHGCPVPSSYRRGWCLPPCPQP